MELRQYQIVLVNLEPTVGAEMRKTRPCVVLSPNEMNLHLATIVVAPITNTSKPYPSRILIQNSKTTGWIVMDQIRTVDRQRIVGGFGSLSLEEIAAVKRIVRELYVD